MDKRVYPRIPIHLPVVITNEDGISLNVFATEASVDGFSIQCSIRERNIITPGGSFIRDGRPVELTVWLDVLGIGKKIAKIKAQCHVTYSRRVASDICHIGVRYSDIDENARKKMGFFIEQKMASNDAGHLSSVAELRAG